MIDTFDTQLADNLLICNCAECGTQLLGAAEENQALATRVYPNPAKRPPTVAGRINDRPYCEFCIKSKTGKRTE